MMPKEAAHTAGQLDRLGFLLARHGNIANRRIQEAIAELGLGQRHGVVLLHLDDGPVSQQFLVETLAIDPSQVVAVLNDLERDELALRRRDPDDRRRHIVEVTARGRAAIESIAQAVSAVERELFADLDPAEVALLRDLLNRVRADIRKACAAAEQPDPSAGTRSAPTWHY
ncbi:MAG TPA: MarR family winged helix-turn-helix transcriptional regulator [Pseudonocardiaceae bacterium]|jgi:DNA-binding MarR family transcriptional regulator|nr:MarR family winged helix-turn-helix transcriptional regulator [Pseudonocardiaceae bacterium]